MHITVKGDPTNPSMVYALELRPALQALLGASPEGQATIVAGAWTPGCQVQDTDLLVLVWCKQPIQIPPDLLPQDLRVRPAYISNFALAVEVKAHTQEAIRFEGNRVLVRYRDPVTHHAEWHGATDQNLKQVTSLKKYVLRHQKSAPYFLPVLWLRNISPTELPPVVHTFIAGKPSHKDLLELLIRLRTEDMRADLLRKPDWKRTYLRCTHDDMAQELLGACEIFTKPLEPTYLDRTKIERITKNALADEGKKYIEKLGTQLLIFRGRGGSGKTVRLLQLAFRLKCDTGARVLVLTYNRALASDLRRLLYLMGFRDGLDDATISMQTSEQFFWDLLKAWDMAPPIADGAPFPNHEYGQRKLDLSDLLRGLSQEQLRSDPAWRANPRLFHWDFVVVDEAQDSPDEERDLLASIFTPERLIVADGVDQLVRRDGPCDWTHLVEPGSRQIVPLRKALRLKSNLCRFVKAFVSSVGLDWDLNLNDDMAGGEVVLVNGPYSRELHDSVFAAHCAAGNRPIDSLFCVTSGSGTKHFSISNTLREWGFSAWDGTDENVKDTIPESVEQYRVVNYMSSRGLEGWTVVCLDFDRFLAQKSIEATKHPKLIYESDEEHTVRFATRWGMIPMTRAIDKLVLQFDGKTYWGAKLLSLAEAQSDYVEIIDS